jgi:hypothetical protein
MEIAPDGRRTAASSRGIRRSEPSPAARVSCPATMGVAALITPAQLLVCKQINMIQMCFSKFNSQRFTNPLLANKYAFESL